MLLDLYNRWLPEGGIEISPDIKYLDVNDTSINERKRTKEFFEEDKEYQKSRRRSFFIKKTGYVRRKIGTYVYKKEEPIGIIISWEIIDGLDGYGDKDFTCSKLIYPKFRHTKYSRYASSDFMHIAFVSGLVNKFYMYVPATNSDSNFYYDIADADNMPCMGIRFSSDGPTVQKYIFVKKQIDTMAGPMALVEFDGEIYKSMNLEEYMQAVPGRSPEVVTTWLHEMNAAAEKVIK